MDVAQVVGEGEDVQHAGAAEIRSAQLFFQGVHGAEDIDIQHALALPAHDQLQGRDAAETLLHEVACAHEFGLGPEVIEHARLDAHPSRGEEGQGRA